MAGEASQAALGETGLQFLGYVTGLCMYWILRASCPPALQGCRSSPLSRSWPWVVLPGSLCQTGGETEVISPLHHLTTMCRSLPSHGMVLLKLKDNGSRNFWHLAYGNLKSYQDQNASETKSHYEVVFKA